MSDSEQDATLGEGKEGYNRLAKYHGHGPGMQTGV